MKRVLVLALVVAAAASLSPAYADRDEDESGHWRRGGYGGREYKEEYWDGHCKVERKWEKNGRYKEERKCDGRTRGYGPVYGGPAYRPALPRGVYVTPPSVVILPPVIVVQ